MNNIIKPFIGIGDYTFDKDYNQIIQVLKDNNLPFTIEIWPNKGCSPEIAWTIIRIEKSFILFFALNKLFKIYIENECDCILENGITLNMDINEALKIDSSLQYNEDEEDYESENGYWIEEKLDNNKVESITIFIKECLNDDIFYSYEWCNK